MQVDLAATADNFDADAFTRGVERMLEIIPHNDHVRLDVTTDLRASVRAKHPNREYAATYESIGRWQPRWARHSPRMTAPST